MREHGARLIEGLKMPKVQNLLQMRSERCHHALAFISVNGKLKLGCPTCFYSCDPDESITILIAPLAYLAGRTAEDVMKAVS